MPHDDRTRSDDPLRAAMLELRNELYRSLGRRRALADYLAARRFGRGDLTGLSAQRPQSPLGHLLAAN